MSFVRSCKELYIFVLNYAFWPESTSHNNQAKSKFSSKHIVKSFLLIGICDILQGNDRHEQECADLFEF